MEELALEKSHNPSEISDNPLEARMPVTLEMASIMRDAAQPGVPGESVKAAIGRAARRLGLPYERARAIWYGQARMIRAEEADRLRARRIEIARQRLGLLQREIDQQNRIIQGMDHAA